MDGLWYGINDLDDAVLVTIGVCALIGLVVSVAGLIREHCLRRRWR